MDKLLRKKGVKKRGKIYVYVWIKSNYVTYKKILIISHYGENQSQKKIGLILEWQSN